MNHPPTTEAEGLREQLIAIVTRNGQSHRIPELLEEELEKLLQLFESTMSSVIGAHVPGNRAVNQHIDVQRKRLAELTNKEVTE